MSTLKSLYSKMLTMTSSKKFVTMATVYIVNDRDEAVQLSCKDSS